MEEGEIRQPLFYVMGRKADPLAVEKLLTITPCFHAVVCRHEDKDLVASLVEEVLQGEDEAACAEFAAHIARTTGRSVLTVGDGKDLKAVYSKGEEETLCLYNLTSTN